MQPFLAYDRSTATVRRIDVDGRLHVGCSNISMAVVNSYLGSEVPGAAALGLDPDRVYSLLRDPNELERAAPTFNNLQLLWKHVPVSAEDYQPELVVGATGSNAAFSLPYLTNSLVIWAAPAIRAIQDESQKELSAAYRYKPVWRPGRYQGVPYQMVMTQIVGNHVALVREGRAGKTVVVGDGRPPALRGEAEFYEMFPHARRLKR